MRNKKPKYTPKNKKSSFYISSIYSNYEIKEHQDTIKCLCLLQDGRLASASKDSAINIYSLKKTNYKCELKLEGHKAFVSCIICLEDGLLISSSGDQTIKIWKINKSDYSCLKTLKERDGNIEKVIQLSKNRLGSFTSYSYIPTIQIWDYTKCIKKIQTKDRFNSLIELKNKIYFVSGETLSFWSTQNYQCQKQFEFRCVKNGLLELEDEKLCVSCFERIIIIGLLGLQIETIFKFPSSTIGQITCVSELNNQNLLLGDSKGFLTELIINEFKFMHKTKIYNEYVKGLLLLNDGGFASFTEGNSITIWRNT